MILLAGHTFDVLVKQTAGSVIYRGRRCSDGQAVVAKLPRHEGSTPLALARLRHEHDILRSLDGQHVVRPLSLERCSHGVALVMEDAGDRSLNTIIAEGVPTIPVFLDLAIRVVQAVEAVHRRRVVHKDLRPDHVLLRDGDTDVRLIDFGLATRLSREAQAPGPADTLEGTLAYMSPEQTGRMNRSVDRRSDLYSLGVTLYELLTGSLPFTSNDPLELVHSHIARRPVSPHERRRDIPRPISDIVMKLLAKAAEDRYQSAAGLRADLEICREALAAGALVDLALGRHDFSDELRIPQKLYGREPELALLRAGYDRARRGAAELFLLRGESGAGKSALVAELGQSLGHGGLFAAGKFDQLGRDVPYAPIRHACRDLLRGLLALPADKLAAWRERLLAALGPNAGLVVELVPELSNVIGPQPEVQPVGAAESQRRFETTFRAFLRAFAMPGSPLVLFLDDLQWADSASLRLLQLLATEPARANLLLIAAYRDNEVGATHPFSRMLEEVRKASGTIRDVEVKVLDLAAVRQLLADTFRAGDDDGEGEGEGEGEGAIGPLAELALRKTRGNPFFLVQFLAALHRDELIRFDAERRAWTWDMAGIDRSTSTENVVDFVIRQLDRLSPDARRLLGLAACIGHELDEHRVAVVAELPAARVRSLLWEALDMGLVAPLDGNYRYGAEPDGAEEGAPQAPNARYRFVHDRVQQTAYAAFDDAEKPAIHLRIGRLLVADGGGAPSPELLFDVVSHWNAGAALVTDPDERRLLARMTLAAGLRARDAAAHAAGNKLLDACLAHLGEDCWRDDYESTFAATLAKAECELLDGGGSGAADALRRLAEAAEHARTSVDRATLRALEIQFLSHMGRMPEAASCALGALADLGMELPEDMADVPAAIGRRSARSWRGSPAVRRGTSRISR